MPNANCSLTATIIPERSPLVASLAVILHSGATSGSARKRSTAFAARSSGLNASKYERKVVISRFQNTTLAGAPTADCCLGSEAGTAAFDGAALLTCDVFLGDASWGEAFGEAV